MRHFSLLALIVYSECTSNGEDQIDVKKSPYYKNGVLNIPISTQSGDELFQRWVDQAFSSLMAAVATDRLPKVSEIVRQRHYKCAKHAEDVQTHARCVSALLKANEEVSKWTRWRMLLGKRRVENRVFRINRGQNGLSTHSKRESQLSINTAAKAVQMEAKTNRRRNVTVKDAKLAFESPNGLVLKRHKRELPEVIQTGSYNLVDESNRSLFGVIAKQLTKTFRSLSNRKGHKSWQEIIRDVGKLVEDDQEKYALGRELKRRLKFFKKAAAEYENGSLSTKNRKLPKLRDFERILLEKPKNQFDVIKGRIGGTSSLEKTMSIPIKLFREGTKLALTIAGHNTTDLERKSLRIISPRLMSLVPDYVHNNKSEVNVFSPSLFSLHNKGNEMERLMSLPNLLNSTGLLDDRDQRDWMEFIFEASGVADAFEKAKEAKKKEALANDIRHVRGPDGQPLYLTKENVTQLYGEFEASKIEVFERLQKSFSPQQINVVSGEMATLRKLAGHAVNGYRFGIDDYLRKISERLQSGHLARDNWNQFVDQG